MLKNIFKSRNLIKIKNITGAVAVVVAVALVSPGVLSLVYSDGEIITDSDIAAYNSTKYAEEETVIADYSGDNDVFSGFNTVPTVTPDPEKSTESEKNSLSKKVKEIMKEKDAVAPKTSKNTSKNKDKNKDKNKATPEPVVEVTAAPTAEPTSAPTAVPTIEPTMEPVAEPTATPETPVIPEEYVHYHTDDVERVEIYDIKTVIESNVLALAAVPKDEYKDRITSVEMVLMYNDTEVERRTASDVSNILEVFPIDVETTGYYEVEFFVTLEETPVETEAPAETEAPVPTEEPVINEPLRQLSSVVYILPEEIDGEIIENPLHEETVDEPVSTEEPLPEATSEPESTPLPEEGVTPEEPSAPEMAVQENVLTEDKIIEEETVAEDEPVQEEVSQE